MILVHGTTRFRAEQILQHGPNPRYKEPGGQTWNDGFSMCVEDGPFILDPPEVYARKKAQHFPGEGGPAILAVDVPDEIVQKADAAWFPVSQGLIQFDEGAGIEELLQAWPTLPKEVRGVP
jgi:hypothetical protein